MVKIAPDTVGVADLLQVSPPVYQQLQHGFSPFSGAKEVHRSPASWLGPFWSALVEDVWLCFVDDFMEQRCSVPMRTVPANELTKLQQGTEPCCILLREYAAFGRSEVVV